MKSYTFYQNNFIVIINKIVEDGFGLFLFQFVDKLLGYL